MSFEIKDDDMLDKKKLNLGQNYRDIEHEIP